MAGLIAAAVPLVLWAVPAAHPGPSVWFGWADHGNAVEQWVVRRGLDRGGYVFQQRRLAWLSGHAADLDDVRRQHQIDPAALVPLLPSESWRLQVVDYGNNHVTLAGGMQLIDSGFTHVMPYHLMSAALATPAAAWVAMGLGWRRGKAVPR